MDFRNASADGSAAAAVVDHAASRYAGGRTFASCDPRALDAARGRLATAPLRMCMWPLLLDFAGSRRPRRTFRRQRVRALVHQASGLVARRAQVSGFVHCLSGWSWLDLLSALRAALRRRVTALLRVSHAGHAQHACHACNFQGSHLCLPMSRRLPFSIKTAWSVPRAQWQPTAPAAPVAQRWTTRAAIRCADAWKLQRRWK